MKRGKKTEQFQNDDIASHCHSNEIDLSSTKINGKTPLKVWQLVLLIFFGMIIVAFAFMLTAYTVIRCGGKLGPCVCVTAYFAFSIAFLIQTYRRKRSWPFLLCIAIAFFVYCINIKSAQWAKTGSSTEQTTVTTVSSDNETAHASASKGKLENRVKVYEYYYSELNKQEKAFYDIFRSNMDKLKSGNCEMNISSAATQEQWEAWYAKGKWNDKSPTAVSLNTAEGAFFTDHPEIFFIDSEKIDLYALDGTDFSMTMKCLPKNKNYFLHGFNSSKEVNIASVKLENEVEKIVVQARKQRTVYEQIRFVQDYLIDHVTYDKTQKKDLVHTAYGALVNHLAVCDGYSSAFKLIMDNLGIPCIVVTGNSIKYDTQEHGAEWVKKHKNDEGHSWNDLKYGYNWYGIDVTWSDSDLPNESLPDRYRYFLRGSKYFLHKEYVLDFWNDASRTLNQPQLLSQDSPERMNDSKLTQEEIEIEVWGITGLAIFVLLVCGMILIIYVVIRSHRQKKLPNKSVPTETE